MGSREERMTNQLTELSNLTGSILQNILKKIVSKLYEQGAFYPSHFVGVTPQTTAQLLRFTDNPNSHISWDKGVSPTKPVKLFLNIDASDITIIWDLLHEYGHLVDGPPSNEEGNQLRSLHREQRAWDIGRKELDNYSQFINAYNSRMEECLNTYAAFTAKGK